jgi:hypothetical protein
MAKYRIKKCSRRDQVWFTAEVRFLLFFWQNVEYGRNKYDTVEHAQYVIERHRKSHDPIKKELIIKL